jgi:hypothetical protein
MVQLSPEYLLEEQHILQIRRQVVLIAVMCMGRVTEEGLSFIDSWTEEYERRDDWRTILNIWNMVYQVVRAWEVELEDGKRPDMSDWHDNQCHLYLLLKYGR